jgi:ABC-type nickel/cobalt efflux system permease component RcnA
VAAYLVGSRGTLWNAVVLGLVVTLTHTGSVILIGLLALNVSQRSPEVLGPWLGVASGLLVAGIGLFMLVARIRRAPAHSHDHRPQGRSPDHHPHAETAADHDPPRHVRDTGRVTLGSLLSLGISGGIVPCPDAIVVLLMAVALNKVALGIAVLLSFSLGLALVLIGVGMSVVLLRSAAGGFEGRGRAVRWLPVVSALVVAALGFAIAIQSLLKSGLLVVRWNL